MMYTDGMSADEMTDEEAAEVRRLASGARHVSTARTLLSTYCNSRGWSVNEAIKVAEARQSQDSN